MLLATRCPHCKTTFKVANDQLKLRSGLVRCGVCQQVFNGIENLSPNKADGTSVRINPAGASATSASPDPAPSALPQPLPEMPAAARPEEPAQPEPDLFESLGIESSAPDKDHDNTAETRIEPVLDNAPSLSDTFFPPLKPEFRKARSNEELETRIQALLDQDLNGEPAANAPDEDAIAEILVEPPLEQTYVPLEPADDAGQRSEFDIVADTRILPQAEPVAHTLGAMRGDPEQADPASDPDDGEEDYADLRFVRQAKNRTRMMWFLSSGVILLLLALVLQLGIQYRNLIAASYAPARDPLIALCKLAGCQIRLPSQLEFISYEADELHSLSRPDTFEFSMLLKNRGTLAENWPSIELTLKDEKKHVLLKKVFAPAEYLDNPRLELAGFAPSTEQPVKLYFELPQLKATDYVVAIFYP